MLGVLTSSLRNEFFNYWPGFEVIFLLQFFSLMLLGMHFYIASFLSFVFVLCSMLLNEIQFRTKVTKNTHNKRQAAKRKGEESPFPGAQTSLLQRQKQILLEMLFYMGSYCILKTGCNLLFILN